MHAILLAAGVGRRLFDATRGGPKCLLAFAGASLLERHLYLLSACRVERLTVVTGYESRQIERALATLAPASAPDMTVATVHNPDFRGGSALSVLAAREVLTGGDDVLLMDADVLYDGRLLGRLAGTTRGNRLAVDYSIDPGDAEAVKVAMRGGKPVGFAKRLPSGLAYEAIGESVGFFRLRPATARALYRACRRAAEADFEAAYEPALQEGLVSGPEGFGAEDITGLPWIEIDYPGDVECGENEIAPRLRAMADSAAG